MSCLTNTRALTMTNTRTLTPLLFASALSLAACKTSADQKTGAPVTLEINQAGTTPVVGMTPQAQLVVLPVSFTSAIAATIFGPKQFTRVAGPPQTFSESFPGCGAPPCQLIVVNGDAAGKHRVSSASVFVNGKQVLGPSDFNQKVDRLVVPVALGANDEVKVTLASAPGSFLTVSVECAGSAELGIEEVASSIVSAIWDDGTLSLSIPLVNDGNVPASNVSITGMSANAGSYLGPTPFVYPVGTLEPDQSQQLYALFANLDGHSMFPLTVSGTYSLNGAVCSFVTQASVQPPPPGNGGAPKFMTSVPRFTASTAVYPPSPPPPAVGLEPNAENVYLPPLGPRRLLASAPPISALDRVLAFAPNDQAPAPGSSPSAVGFVRNTNGGNYSNFPPDPSAAGADPSGFVLISANNSAGAVDGAVSYSTDFGKTFKTVNLTSASGFKDLLVPGRTDFFPQSDGGLCCDQVVHYIPGRNLVVWLLQYWSPNVNIGGLTQKGQNRLRIAWATPQAAAADFLHAWSWFDVSPTTLSDTTATDWMDYPDLAYSNGWLYISVDHGFWNAATDSKGNVIGQQVFNNRRWFVRASLDDMANNRSSINLVYYEPIKAGLVKSHFVQSAPDTMYYTAQPDTSTLSVFADLDSSPNVPMPKDLGTASRCSNAATNPCDYSVTAPDGLNWNVAPHGVLGGAYVAPSIFCPPSGCTGPTKFLYFAYDGARDNSAGRAFPYVRVTKVDADAIAIVSEMDIWNSAFAFATPALTWRAGSFKDEVVFSLATGGGGGYADNAVGFIGDFVAYVTTSSNATQSDSASNVRYGDYFSVRNSSGPVTANGQGIGYSTLGYAVTQVTSGKTCAVGGCNIALQYVLFGRNEELFPPPRDPGPK